MSMPPRVTWFDEKTRKRIVAEALQILEKVGVFVENDEAIELLAGAGANVEGGRVMIPPALVEKALASAPSRILSARGIGSSSEAHPSTTRRSPRPGAARAHSSGR